MFPIIIIFGVQVHFNAARYLLLYHKKYIFFSKIDLTLTWYEHLTIPYRAEPRPRKEEAGLGTNLICCIQICW